MVTLDALLDHGHDVALVVTGPDRRRGRGGKTSPSAVKRRATQRAVPVAHDVAAVREVDVERAVVVAFGALIPASLLATTPMLNVHFSLLPRWRGAAPVHHAVLAGDSVTGVSIMTLEPTLDTGPIHLVRTVEVGEKTVDDLTRELGVVGASALLEVLDTPTLLGNSTPQVGPVTYASKITSLDRRLSPRLDVTTFVRTVRLGGAHLFAGPTRLIVHRACPSDAPVPEGRFHLIGHDLVVGLRDGSVVLLEVQPGGSTVVSGRQWWFTGRASKEETTWS